MNTEIVSITASVKALKAELKVTKTVLKKAEKEMTSLEVKKERMLQPRVWLRNYWLAHEHGRDS